MEYPRFSFSEKRIAIYLFKIIAVLATFLLLAYLGLGWSIRSILSDKNYLDPKFIATVIVMILAFVLGMLEITFLKKAGTWLDKQIFNLKNALKGNAGEKKTFERLGHMLGAEYKIHRNFQIPGRKFDIDAIVVGPKGVITFEIKNLGVEGDIYRFDGSDVYKITKFKKGDECSCRLGKLSNPISEVVRHNLALEEWQYK